MFDYYFDEIDLSNVIAAVRSYNQREAVKIRKYYRYYNGSQDILDKVAPEGRPNNKIVTNFCKSISDIYLSFLELDDGDYINRPEFMSVIRDTIICGTGYAHQFYVDGVMNIKRLKPTKSMVFRDTSLNHNPIAAAMWNEYKVYENGYTKDKFDLYVFDAENRYYYSGTALETVTLISKEPHYFGNVPIVEFHAFRDYSSVFSPAIPLQDSYNMIDSSYADGRETFSNAFLLIKGVMLPDEDEVDKIVNGDKKILNLPTGEGDASYLVKADSATEVINFLNDIRRRIFNVCNAPDTLDNTFGNYSGLALKLKYAGFLNCLSSIKTELATSEAYVSDVIKKSFYIVFTDIDLNE